MRAKNFLQIFAVILAAHNSQVKAENIFQKIFGSSKTPTAEAPRTQLAPSAFDVQRDPGVKVNSQGKPDTRKYITPNVSSKLQKPNVRSSSTVKSSAKSSTDQSAPFSESGSSEDTSTSSYDSSEAARQALLAQISTAKEDTANSAFFNSIYSSAIFTQALRKVNIIDTGVEKNLQQALFDKLNDLAGDPNRFKLNLNDLQMTFFASLNRFITENPALGGNPLRGFEPKITNALISTLLSNTIPMTPDGILLLPFNEEYEFRFADFKESNGTIVESTLVLVDRRGNLLNELGKPIIPHGYKTLGEYKVDANGNMLRTSDGSPIYEDSITDWTFLDQLQNVAPKLASAFSGKALFVQNKPEFDSYLRTQAIDLNDIGAIECFKQWLAAGNLDSSIADCFTQLGSDLGNEIKTVINQGGITFIRGAVGGGLLSKAFNGINVSTGFTAGGIANVFGFLYNRYFKKEKLSSAQINGIVSFINAHTFKQGQWGIIQPGTDNGIWGVTSTGLITRYRKMAVKTLVGQNENGERVFRTQEANVRLDLNGRPLQSTSTIQYDDVFASNNLSKLSRALTRISLSSKNPKAPAAALHSGDFTDSADDPNSVLDSNEFVQPKTIEWTSEPKVRAKAQTGDVKVQSTPAPTSSEPTTKKTQSLEVPDLNTPPN